MLSEFVDSKRDEAREKLNENLKLEQKMLDGSVNLIENCTREERMGEREWE